MTKRLIILLSVLMMMASAGLTGASGVSAAPGQKREGYTYKGVTYSWSKSDYSDLQITMTPRAKDNLPAGVNPGDIPEMAIPQQAGTVSALADYCTHSPESYLGANFRPACRSHDRCYSASSRTSRLVCDQAFRNYLGLICFAKFSAANPLRYSCASAAVTYYGFVRRYARSHYDGRGNPA